MKERKIVKKNEKEKEQKKYRKNKRWKNERKSRKIESKSRRKIEKDD